MSTKHVTCRYYIHGVCREGSRCLFSHDPNTSKPSTICKFYQRGTCAYGERCRYDHIKPSFRGGGGASEEPSSVGGATESGGGASNELTAGGGGGGARRRAAGKKPLVLRDRGVCSESVPVGGASRVEQEVASPPHSYVAAIRAGLGDDGGPAAVGGASSSQLCPFAAAGNCYYGDSCPYLHGDRCDVCGLQVLHPTNQEQRTAHHKMCLLMFEVDMEKAFAAQLSEDKVCSICMELVVQKSSLSERRFGILSSCCHVFCLSCIRRWRCSPNFSNSIIKACPECRVASEFVIPSSVWVEDQQQKDHLIEVFKSGTSKKSCKYFSEGRGTCPFGSRCLYLHAFPDGTRAEPDAPRKQLSSAGNVRFMNSVRLWDFIEERDQRSDHRHDNQRSAAPLDDDLTELFMQMSHDDNQEEAPPPGQQ